VSSVFKRCFWLAEVSSRLTFKHVGEGKEKKRKEKRKKEKATKKARNVL
jgi:hypothetical protein